MTKSYILTADDVVDSLESTDQSIPLSANQGRVLNESKQNIMQVSAMQTASETHYGKIVQFVGTSTSDYINGYFYQCILDSTVTPPVYKWVAKSVQAGGGGGGGTWGSITGTLSDQTDLQTALDAKVTAVAGKGLSTEDYTTTDKTKLAGIADGAEVNVQSDWNQTDDTSDDFIKNKPTSMTPSAHASTHASDGADAITIAESQVTNLVTDLAGKQDALPTTSTGGQVLTSTSTEGTVAWADGYAKHIQTGTLSPASGFVGTPVAGDIYLQYRST